MVVQERGKDVGVVLALLAHAAVLHVHGDPLELRHMLSRALARLDRLEDLDGIVDAELAGMALGAHAVLGIVVIELLESEPASG